MKYDVFKGRCGTIGGRVEGTWMIKLNEEHTLKTRNEYSLLDVRVSITRRLAVVCPLWL